MNHNIQDATKRRAEPARRVFEPALFDAIPKAVFGHITYQLARYGDDVGDQGANLMWFMQSPKLVHNGQIVAWPSGVTLDPDVAWWSVIK